MKVRTSSLLAVLFLCLTLSCSFVPLQEQLVTSTEYGSLFRNNGDCSKNGLTFNIDRTVKTLPGLSPESISILDWNIYKEQQQNWDIDFLRLSLKKDIVFLQEASLNNELQRILQQTKLYWSLNSAFKFKGVDTGVLVASQIQPVESCGLRHNEPIIGIPKTILINSYPITGSQHKLLVANIHGINITFGVGAYRNQLDSLADILQLHSGPIIVAGDFNSWNKKRIALMMDLAKNLALRALVFNDDHRTTFFGDPVDHIFYRGLEPISQSVHRVESSDHNPISATFRLSLIDEGTKSKPL